MIERWESGKVYRVSTLCGSSSKHHTILHHRYTIWSALLKVYIILIGMQASREEKIPLTFPEKKYVCVKV